MIYSRSVDGKDHFIVRHHLLVKDLKRGDWAQFLLTSGGKLVFCFTFCVFKLSPRGERLARYVFTSPWLMAQAVD